MSDTVQQERAGGGQSLERVVIRFAGDSGDGMQLTGDRFTASSAMFGNDLATLPNYPAEIRAPAGTLAGVSAFQVHISDHDILTPGDAPSVLIAMNPAALKSELHDVTAGGTLLVNSDAFDERALQKAGYATNPLTDGSLSGFTVYEVPMTSMTLEAAKPTGAKPRDAERSKNFFALGVVSWMYTRPVEDTIEWIAKRFAKNPIVRDANLLAFKAGYNFGETAELFATPYEVHPAPLEPGTYTNMSGNVALAWGLIAAGQLAKLPVFLASYPITPASDILHELSKHKNFGVRTMQAEDEIAAAGAALGSAFAGHLAVTTTSGPGVDLKAETIGLAISMELPMLLIDIQRGGPSTGLPTKTEQADLMLAMYGRHGESPLPIVAASTPSGCFSAAIEAARLALKYRTPVILLSDGFLANGTEPWRLPKVEDLPDISVPFATAKNSEDGDTFLPYFRDPVTLARPWAIPGTPGLEHRIGGIEKEDVTGNISYDPANHERMTRLRQAKIAGIAKDIPLVEVDDPTGDAETLVIGWGSTEGSIKAAVRMLRARGKKIAQANVVHLSPFPPNLGDVVGRYRKVLVPEMNLGQLVKLLRADFLVDARSYTKVQGLPFRTDELEAAIGALIDE
ncbi:MAG TPA: 2-oxoacid:acceptor oxidoreductase subunit alpha [Acidimicrobiales bacterium]|nr:2-oxoacid:acceptor oxidoreductase subunit alpha [Acidimicrobiales bacterium]